MGILDKLKKKVKEQEQESQKSGTSQTGDRLPNKIKDDNIYGDKQAKKEGADIAEGTPRGKARRDSFNRQNRRGN